MSEFVWASVTGLSPLRVKLDGDSVALPMTPETLVPVAQLTVADRVRCEIANRRVVVVGLANGMKLGALRSSGTIWATTFAAIEASSVTATADFVMVTTVYTGIERHQWTRVDGTPNFRPVGMIFATSKANMDAYIAVVFATTRFGFQAGGLWFDAGTSTHYRFTSATGTYRALAASVPIIPTVTGTGGTSTVASATGEVTFSGANTVIRVNSTTAILSTFRYIECILSYDGSTSGSHTVQLTLGSSIDSTASAYRQSNVSDGVPAVPAATTSFSQGYSGSRKKRRRRLEIFNLAVARPTMIYETGVDGDGAATPVNVTPTGDHNVSTAFDGLVLNLSSMGTLSNGSLQLIGHY